MTAGNDFDPVAEPKLFSALLMPHRSLNRTRFLVLMTFVSVISCAAGGVFWWIGAWPVFGFFCLDVVVIYCSGLGAVEPTVTAGEAASTTILSRTSNPVEVTIGGVKADVLFAGLTPQYVGLYQVNARIPAGVAAGDSVELRLTTMGQTNPAVTMAVR